MATRSGTGYSAGSGGGTMPATAGGTPAGGMVGAMPTISMFFEMDMVTNVQSLIKFRNYILKMQEQYMTPGAHDPIINGTAFFPTQSEDVKSLKETSGVTDPLKLMEYLEKRHKLDTAEHSSVEQQVRAIDEIFRKLEPQPQEGKLTITFESLRHLLEMQLSTINRHRELKPVLEVEKALTDGKALTERKVVNKIFEKITLFGTFWSRFLESEKIAVNEEAKRLVRFVKFLNWDKLKNAWDLLMGLDFNTLCSHKKVNVTTDESRGTSGTKPQEKVRRQPFQKRDSDPSGTPKESKAGSEKQKAESSGCLVLGNWN
jgi:hypothetical protein